MFKTKAELKDEILEVVDEADEPMTATAISRAVGYTKLRSRVADALADLVSDGELETGVDGCHTTYAISVDADEDEEEEETLEPPEEPIEISEITLPENLNGYDVEMLPKNHVKVIFPPNEEGERKEVVLEPNERLLVISDDYRFIVSEPEHVLEAIHTYTLEQGITTYLVTDMSTGQKVPDVTDINMKVAIIFIQISRHNKAGL